MKLQIILAAAFLYVFILSANLTNVFGEEGDTDHFAIEAKPSRRPDFKIIQLENVNGVFNRKIMIFGISIFSYSGGERRRPATNC